MNHDGVVLSRQRTENSIRCPKRSPRLSRLCGNHDKGREARNVKHFAHSTPQTQRRKRGRHFFLSTTLSASARTCTGFYIDCLRRNGCGKQCPQSCKGRKGHMSPVELSCTCPISVLERFLESRIESCKSGCPASNVPAFTCLQSLLLPERRPQTSHEGVFTVLMQIRRNTQSADCDDPSSIMR